MRDKTPVQGVDGAKRDLNGYQNADALSVWKKAKIRSKAIEVLRIKVNLVYKISGLFTSRPENYPLPNRAVHLAHAR